MEKIDWQKTGKFADIEYERFEAIAKITINRPEVRNSFRPETVREICGSSRSGCSKKFAYTCPRI